MSERYKERLAKFETTLLFESSHIDLDQLRLSCRLGIPEALRPICWRLLLGYMPIERSTWSEYLSKQRENYDVLVEDIIVHLGQPHVQHKQSNADDHPLSLSPQSKWQHYFNDNEVLVQIDKDVRRLCPEIEFFQRLSQHPHRSAAKVNLSKRINQETLPSESYESGKSALLGFISSPSKVAIKEYINSTIDESAEYHWQVVERILFIYSKLNPGVKYVQGMNEIVGPIYYVMATDSDIEWAPYAEADTYFCFQLLMSQIKDNFIATLDRSNCGIESVMSKFCDRLNNIDDVLYNHLVSLSVKPQFYAFRWLLLLLSQEFQLPDVITVWDSLFSSTDLMDFLRCLCLAMMVKKRDELLSADFSKAVKILQNFHEDDVSQIVYIACEIKDGLYKRKSYNNGGGNKKSPIEAVISLQTNKIVASVSNALKNLSKK